MRRSLFLLVLALAGCGRSSGHDTYLAAAAELDRENAKLDQIASAANGSHWRAASLAYLMIHCAVPTEKQLADFRRNPGDYGFALSNKIHDSMPEVIAVRAQGEKVRQLRRLTKAAEMDWIATKRGQSP